MDVVINAPGGNSKKVVLQRLGRVLRKITGKVVGICIDFMDYDLGKKTLLKHSKSRLKTYEELGFEITMIDKKI